MVGIYRLSVLLLAYFVVLKSLYCGFCSFAYPATGRVARAREPNLFDASWTCELARRARMLWWLPEGQQPHAPGRPGTSDHDTRLPWRRSKRDCGGPHRRTGVPSIPDSLQADVGLDSRL